MKKQKLKSLSQLVRKKKKNSVGLASKKPLAGKKRTPMLKYYPCSLPT